MMMRPAGAGLTFSVTATVARRKLVQHRGSPVTVPGRRPAPTQLETGHRRCGSGDDGFRGQAGHRRLSSSSRSPRPLPVFGAGQGHGQPATGEGLAAWQAAAALKSWYSRFYKNTSR